MLNWMWRFSHSMTAIAVPHSDYRGWEILRSLVDHMQYIPAEVIPTSCKLLALYHIITYGAVEEAHGHLQAPPHSALPKHLDERRQAPKSILYSIQTFHTLLIDDRRRVHKAPSSYY